MGSHFKASWLASNLHTIQPSLQSTPRMAKVVSFILPLLLFAEHGNGKPHLTQHDHDDTNSDSNHQTIQYDHDLGNKNLGSEESHQNNHNHQHDSGNDQHEAGKNQNNNHHHHHHQDHFEFPEYQVMDMGEEDERGYQKRLYPATLWVCTNMTVDTASDPLANLESYDIFEIRKSNRYKTKVPSSLLFHKLYHYLNGSNEDGVKMKMTKGGYIKHSLLKEDTLGDIELQERCIYLESQYQSGLKAPKPRDPRVYLYQRPELVLFVKTFPRWLFTSSSWQKDHSIFNGLLEDKEQFDKDTYYTRNSGYHWVPQNDRSHEIWVPEISRDERIKVKATQRTLL